VRKQVDPVEAHVLAQPLDIVDEMVAAAGDAPAEKRLAAADDPVVNG
jgi:hypothetical protein